MKSRLAFSLIELLICALVICVLAGMLMPAVQKARAASQRAECSNNLHQQGVALYCYHQDFRRFPPALINPGYWGDKHRRQDFYRSGTYKVYNHTGYTLLLPYIEPALAKQYNHAYPSCDAVRETHPYFSAADLAGGGLSNCPEDANRQVVSTPVKIYKCPSEPEDLTDTIDNELSSYDCTDARRCNYLLCTYDGYCDESPEIYLTSQRGVFGVNESASLSEIVDGAASTIMAGETRYEHFSQPFWETFEIYRHVPHWGAGHRASMTGAMVFVQIGADLDLALFRLPINGEAGRDRYVAMFSGMGRRNPEYRKLLPYGYGSHHPGGAYFLFADGSVHFLRQNMSYPLYVAMGSIQGKEQIGSWE